MAKELLAAREKAAHRGLAQYLSALRKAGGHPLSQGEDDRLFEHQTAFDHCLRRLSEVSPLTATHFAVLALAEVSQRPKNDVTVAAQQFLARTAINNARAFLGPDAALRAGDCSATAFRYLLGAVAVASDANVSAELTDTVRGAANGVRRQNVILARNVEAELSAGLDWADRRLPPMNRPAFQAAVATTDEKRRARAVARDARPPVPARAAATLGRVFALPRQSVPHRASGR